MHVLLNKEFEWFVAFFMENLYCVLPLTKAVCAKNLFQLLKYLISALLCLDSRKFNPDNINKL